MPKRKFYITTAIDYVNATPHLGTAYEKIGADVLARYYRLKGWDTFFMMGTDEHSINVEKQAASLGMDPRKYCDDMCSRFTEVWKKLEISYDFFMRTTDDYHIKTVQDIFTRIHKNEDIYKGLYKGWYCVSCERFLQEKDLIDEKCPVHDRKPDWIEEENYFFRLRKYQDRLREHIERHADFILPKTRQREILNVISKGLDDISVTRSSVKWGIPLPFDTSQVVYVWFDALINYVSGIGYVHDRQRYEHYWPADVHVIGKDITRFHCIIWPAMLMAAGIELPRTIYGHGFVHMSGDRMSKTTGTMVDPLTAAARYGPEALRYYLMREVPFDRDGDFSWENFENRYNADLANDLGNLANRVLSMIKKYRACVIPLVSETGNDTEDNELKAVAQRVLAVYETGMEALNFSTALVQLWKLVNQCNVYVEQTAPWNLNKNNEQERLSLVLHAMAQCLGIICKLVAPFMPLAAEKMWVQLGQKGDFPTELFDTEGRYTAITAGGEIGTIEPLFPKEEA